MLPNPSDQIWSCEKIGSVAGDSACNTRRCQGVVAARDAHAVIPSRKSVSRMMRSVNRFGQGQMVQDFDCQVAERQVRIDMLEGIGALGPRAIEPAGQFPVG